MALLLLVPAPSVEERFVMAKAARQKMLAAQKSFQSGQSKTKPPPARLPGGHLIVCPTSVIRQWARELREKVTRGM